MKMSGWVKQVNDLLQKADRSLITQKGEAKSERRMRSSQTCTSCNEIFKTRSDSLE
jgi:hypothetical protein